MSNGMNIEKIEKFLSDLYELLEQNGAEELSVNSQLHFVQCQLLLHICKKPESIDDTLITMCNPTGKEKP